MELEQNINVAIFRIVYGLHKRLHICIEDIIITYATGTFTPFHFKQITTLCYYFKIITVYWYEGYKTFKSAEKHKSDDKRLN